MNFDCRDSNRQWWESFDERAMTCTTYSEEVIPVKYEVCETCGGKGKHVNPGIDSHGLSAEDFYEDPDFAENYVSGIYDVPCNECHGNRVALVVDEERATQEQQDYVEQWFRDEHADRVTRWYESGCPQ